MAKKSSVTKPKLTGPTYWPKSLMYHFPPGSERLEKDDSGEYTGKLTPIGKEMNKYLQDGVWHEQKMRGTLLHNISSYNMQQ